MPEHRPDRGVDAGSASAAEQSRADVAFHAERASTYDGDVTRDFAIYDALALRPYLDTLRPGVVADIGCGTGEVAIQLAARGFAVTAVDHSPDMIEVARAKSVKAGVHERITFLRSEITELPLADSSLDGLTCQRVLHHVPELEAALAEFNRVLKPGGFLYVSDYLGDDPGPIRALRRLKHMSRRRPANGATAAFLDLHEVRRSAVEFLDALRRAGFDVRYRFYSHLAARYLPAPRIRVLTIRALSYPWRHRRGSMVFVFGVKR